MAIREELIDSAISFLRDPSVASAPIEKRIAFLQSKNLTQEEVDVALARAGGDDGGVAQATAVNPSSYQYRPQGGPSQYGGYPGYWQQPPPPDVPKRDWRDWFIMATVLGGVSYGVYFTAKRYIVPLIAPPTPPQLEADKQHVDQSFEKAFALLEQLSTDTDTLKSAEESRTQRLDTALADLEATISALKESDRRRDDDARRTADEVRGLRDLIPKALEANKESQEARLKELGTELKSLKTLVGNRVSGGPRAGESAVNAGALRAQSGLYQGAQPSPASQPSQSPAPQVNGPNGTAAASTTTAPAVQEPQSTQSTNGLAPSTNGTEATDRSKSPSSYSRFSSGKAAIPAWQMAAQKKQSEQEQEKKADTSESGTVTETTVGA